MNDAENEKGSAMKWGRGSFDLEAEACRQELRRYARHLTRCEARADDLVQETLLRAMHSWKSFRQGSRMVAWLRTILFHLFVNDHRARSRFVEAEGYGEPYGEESVGAWFDAEHARDPDQPFLRDALRDALEELSPEHREAVRLSDVEGFAGEEIAELLGVPVGTVKSRLFRARQRLRLTLSGPASELGYGLGVRA